MSDSGLGLSFGRAAQEYERGRPEWPATVVDLAGPPAADATVLDLAAGTGKLTRLLVRRFPRVVAVEPDESMRSLLEARVPEAEALAGSAEAIPLPDASVDAAFVAEAFHWFDYEPALGELARVLRPGAPLVLLWNEYPDVWEPTMPPDADDALTRRFRLAVGPPGMAIYRSGVWRGPFAQTPFEPLREEQIEHEHVVDREGMIAHWLSVSSIASLPDEERAALAAELRELLPDVEHRLRIRVEAHVTRRI